MKETIVPQEEIDQLIENLIEQIRNSGKQYDYVVGIREGGINVSLPISERLNLPHKTVKISFYDKNGGIDSDGFVFAPNGLLVDDLVDGGKTILTFYDKFGKLDTAVLFWKRGAIKPEYYGQEKPEGWLVFPWELCYLCHRRQSVENHICNDCRTEWFEDDLEELFTRI